MPDPRNALGFALAWGLLGSVVVGALAGLAADAQWGTSPWCTAGLPLLLIVATLISLGLRSRR